MTDLLPIVIGRTCHRCAGTGWVLRYDRYGVVTCHVCGGSGQQPAERDDVSAGVGDEGGEIPGEPR